MDKKIFMVVMLIILMFSISFASAAESNETIVSASVGDEISSNSDFNGIYQLDDDSSNDYDSEELINTTMVASANRQGVIEDGDVIISANITDADGNLIPNVHVRVYVDGKHVADIGDHNGTLNYVLSGSTGYRYCNFYFIEESGFATSKSNVVEVAFAKGNTLSDLAILCECADGNVLNLTKDYLGYGDNIKRYDVSTANESKPGDYGKLIHNYDIRYGIPINEDLVINGNGHKIDLTDDDIQRSVFDIESGNFTLNNLSISNGYTNNNAYSIIAYRDCSSLYLNNVNISNCSSLDGQGIIDPQLYYNPLDFHINVENSIFSNNTGGSIFSSRISNSTFEQNIFFNNSNVFIIENYFSVNIRNNIFVGNPSIFKDSDNSIWEYGEVKGNYFGTNDTDYINNNILPAKNPDINYKNEGHSYLTISGNTAFCEDDVQDYEIYFSGNTSDKLPIYKTMISFTSACSTINATNINISSNPTTVRVTPKTYGVETLTVEPNLYELNINITKSPYANYKVSVEAPETEYSIPLIITVNVFDLDDNPVTTAVNITIGGKTHTINVTDGNGTLQVNNLIPGNYDITTKVISNMNNYRNTTIYSSTNITKATPIITLSCNNTTSIAREVLTLIVKTQNTLGNNLSSTVYIEEDGIEIGSVNIDENGNAIYQFRPEAGNHIYVAKTPEGKYWKSSESNPVGVDVTGKIPAKLTISSDTDFITDKNQKATFNVKLTDVDNVPIVGVAVKLVANDVVVDSANTDNAGECEFEFTNSSNLYRIKAVYDGNLSYYDNSSETIDLIIATGANFFDLSVLINSTEEDGVLTLDRDFTFNETIDQDFVNGIPITKNIAINGNNKIINALNKAKVFNINANNVTIDNLSFVNASSLSSGGAIYFDGETLSISNSKFEGNVVTLLGYAEKTEEMGGGAIYSNGVLNIANSTFNNNKLFIHNDAFVDFSGGGVIFANNDLNIHNSIFDSNVAIMVKIIEKDIAFPARGSSLYINGGITSIHNSTFKNGLADISSINYYNYVSGNFSLYDCVFLNNTALLYNGVGSIISADGRIINSTFENNFAKSMTGGVYVQSTKFLIGESKFINNSANNFSSAVMVNSVENVTVEKSYFINNHIIDGGTIEYGESTGLTLRYNIFLNNTGNASGVYYQFDEGIDGGNFNYDYWGNNTPYDADVFNEYIRKGYEYITLEIIGENVTYTTIPTTYTIKFNGTNSDKLPNLETLIEALAESDVTLDKSNIIINGSGAKVVLTSNEVQNITLVVGPEYNVLALFNIAVEQLIKKNYTSDITLNTNEYGSMVVATIEILDEDGKGINGSLTYTFSDKIENATIENGIAQIPLGRLDAGEYDIGFIYNSTDLFYNDLSGNKSFNIAKANTTFTLDVTDITYGEDEIIKATPQRGVDGNFTFYIKGILNQTVEIEFGEASYALSDLPAGNYTVTVTYNGNKNYNPSTQSKNFTVSKASSEIRISIEDVNYGDDIIAVVMGVNVTGNVTVNVKNKDYPVEVVNNRGNVTIDKLGVGKYNAIVIFNGNSNVTGLTNESEFNVNKASSNMTVDIGESILGQITTISVKFRDDVEGTVTITVDGTPNKLTIKNGTAILNLTDLTEGRHDVNVAYQGNDNFNSSELNTSFSTKSLASQIIVTSSDTVYGSDLVVKASVASDATGNVEFTINNVTKTAAIKNGVAEVSFSDLNAGSYEITAKYLGDEVYISSTNTTSAAVEKANSYVLIDVGEIREGENVIIKFTVPSKATGIITVEIPGLYTPRNRTLANGVNTWTITPLKSGTYTLNVVYNGDNNYLTSSNSTALISKAYPIINIDVGESAVGQDVTINVMLPENATGSVLISVDGIKYNKTLKNAEASVVISNITKGTHNVDVTYSGDEYYYSSSNSTSFEPKSLNSNINVMASDISFGEDLVVRAIVNEGATGTVTFTVNGADKTVQLHQGFASATFTNIDAGTYDVKAVYSGNDVYSSSANSTEVSVLKSNSMILISVGEIKEGQNVQIKFTASKLATGNITLEIPGLYSSRVRQLTNNEYTWTIAPLSAGLYQVIVSYDGDKNYYGSSNSTYIDYNRVKTTLDVDSILTKNNVRLTANLTAENGQLITAWVNVTVNGTKYRIPVYNGTGHLDLGSLEGGDYQYFALYAGTRTIVNSTDEGSFTVIPVEPILTVPDVVKYYKGSERLYVYLIDNYNDSIVNKTVVITINGNSYTRTTDANGTASMALNLNSGKYQATVKADDYSLQKAANVTILPTVNGTDVVKIYRNATQYYATFRDSQGNYLADGSVVNFNINGVFYERKVSGDKGLAKLNLNLPQGEYIITAMNPVTGEKAANDIKVISKIVENKDITKYYKNGTQYSVKILGDDGKAVGAGVEVTFNINGVFYTRQTNASGIAKLTINLIPGDYIITAEYGGCKISNNIKVLPVLSAKDFSKKYGTSDQFVATLVDGQGKPYAGQTVKFNINGVFYNRVTNDYGQARLNINLMAGQYIITSSYNGFNIANKVTIIP